MPRPARHHTNSFEGGISVNRIKLLFALGASVAVLANQGCNSSAPSSGRTSEAGRALTTAGTVAGLSLRVDLFPYALPGETFPVEVSFRNTAGQLMNVADNITVSLSTNPTAATMTGTTTKAPANGVARFDLTLGKVGQGYGITASSTQAGTATSALFSVAYSQDVDTAANPAGYTLATAPLISPKVPMFSILAPGEVQYYRFRASAGQQLGVLSYANRIAMASWDTAMRVRLIAPDGTTEVSRVTAVSPDARGVDSGVTQLRIPQDGDFFIASQSAQNLQLDSVIPPRLHILEMRPPRAREHSRIHALRLRIRLFLSRQRLEHGKLRAVRLHHQGRVRREKRWVCPVGNELDESIHAGQENPRRVRDLHLGEKSPRPRVQSVRSARHLAGEASIAKLLYSDVSCLAHLDSGRVRLRDQHENTQLADFSHAKYFSAPRDVGRRSRRRSRSLTRSRRGDERPNIRISRSDDPGEGRRDPFITLQRDQSLQGGSAGANKLLPGPDILFAGGHIRFGGLGRRLLRITVLARHRAAGGQHLVSLPGDIGQIARRDKLLQGGLRLSKLPLRLRDGSLGLRHLLIEIRSIDFSQ